MHIFASEEQPEDQLAVQEKKINSTSGKCDQRLF